MTRCFWLAATIVAVMVCSPALGVVIAGGDGSGNTTGYALDGNPVPGWDYIGTYGAGAAVYLGDGWVLTAAHLLTHNTVTFAGVTYTVDSGPRYQLDNPDDAWFGDLGKTDLVMFRLASTSGSPDWPALAPLNIASSPVQTDTDVVMIGNGYNRQASPVGYDSDWTAVSVDSEECMYSGFRYAGTKSLRWGTNVVSAGPFLSLAIKPGELSSFGFLTTFRDGASDSEAQAADGDSGGGVFGLDGTLLGIMVGKGQLAGQPGNNLALYGNQTYTIDLSYYRSQILAIAPSLAIPEPVSLTTMLAASAFMLLRKRRP